jgi:methylase of polypeptide subunit release factors
VSGEVQDDALRLLLQHLDAKRYRFITPTPATHARILARVEASPAGGGDTRSILGWNHVFHWDDDPDDDVVHLLRRADALEEDKTSKHLRMRSRIRVSSLDDLLFLHSAYPTVHHDDVFFGPDSYRFAAFLKRELPRLGALRHLVDMGAGSGVGGIIASRATRVARITLLDINSKALRYAKINAIFAGVPVETVLANNLDAVEGDVDCIIANPPYIVDAAHRAYRDGGAMHGAEISIEWAKAAARRLRSGGTLLLYTGAAIVEGEDGLEQALRGALRDFDVEYRELDPDVFGEELERAEYADVERIAVVGVVATKR